jgi:hypothetical protein
VTNKHMQRHFVRSKVANSKPTTTTHQSVITDDFQCLTPKHAQCRLRALSAKTMRLNRVYGILASTRKKKKREKNRETGRLW